VKAEIQRWQQSSSSLLLSLAASHFTPCFEGEIYIFGYSEVLGSEHPFWRIMDFQYILIPSEGISRMDGLIDSFLKCNIRLFILVDHSPIAYLGFVQIT
jgi:hypothetical protein